MSDQQLDTERLEAQQGPEDGAPAPAPEVRTAADAGEELPVAEQDAGGGQFPVAEADGGGEQPPVAEADHVGEPVSEQDELAVLAAQRDEYLALAQRTQADFENYRKRALREAKLAEARGIGKVVKELLPALDNLERAIGHAAQDDPLLEGIRLVAADLTSALGRLGVESYSPQGERFDPEQHEAMAQHPVEGAEAGTVVEVYQPGYRLAGGVIRPARVVVAA
jgi:molecular chaperone GrpE